MLHFLDKTPNPQIIMDLGAVGGGVFLETLFARGQSSIFEESRPKL